MCSVNNLCINCFWKWLNCMLIPLVLFLRVTSVTNKYMFYIQVFVHYTSLSVFQSKMKSLSPLFLFKTLWVSFSWRTQMMMLGALFFFPFFHRKENKRDRCCRTLIWHKTPWKKVNTQRCEWWEVWMIALCGQQLSTLLEIQLVVQLYQVWCHCFYIIWWGKKKKTINIPNISIYTKQHHQIYVYNFYNLYI